MLTGARFWPAVPYCFKLLATLGRTILVLHNPQWSLIIYCFSVSALGHPNYGVVPKGWLTFLGFFMQCGVYSLLDTSGIYSGTYSLGWFVGLFSDAMGNFFTDRIVWDDKDNVICFKRWWSTGSPKFCGVVPKGLITVLGFFMQCGV